VWGQKTYMNIIIVYGLSVGKPLHLEHGKSVALLTTQRCLCPGDTAATSSHADCTTFAAPLNRVVIFFGGMGPTLPVGEYNFMKRKAIAIPRGAQAAASFFQLYPLSFSVACQ
jgi:hypothetical protein